MIIGDNEKGRFCKCKYLFKATPCWIGQLSISEILVSNEVGANLGRRHSLGVLVLGHLPRNDRIL